MSILINKDKCVGCRKCKEACPGNLIKIDENNKAFIKNPKHCWGCASCVKECKANAIKYYLGADMGGKGGTLTTETKGDITYWNIEKSNGEKVTIEVNRNNANAY